MRLVGLLLFVGLTGCATSEPGPPPGDLDRIATIVAELQLANSVATEVAVPLRDSVSLVLFHKVLADHGTDSVTFERSMQALRREPAWVDSVFTRAGVILTRLEVERRSDTTER